MATTIPPALLALRPVELTPCPGCGTDSYTDTHGHARYCLPCTERELGMTAWQNSRRIELGMTQKRYLADDDLIPRTPREWRQWVSQGGTSPSPRARSAAARKWNGA